MADGGTQETGMARSTFVTVVAWFFIVISGLATLLLTMQVAAFYFLLNPQMQAAMHTQHDMKGAPQWARFFLEHPWIFVVGFWLFALLTLLAAVGLLLRANWARILFIVILGIGIVWNLGGMIVQGFFLSRFPGIPIPTQQTFPEFAAQWKAMEIAIVAVTATFAIVVSVLFGWIMKRLISPRIRAEFGAI